MGARTIAPMLAFVETPMSTIFVNPYRHAAVGADWWDPDGESLAVVGAYRAIGAASLAASYVNLANPGTNDLTVASPNIAPAFSAVTGWAFSGGNMALDTGIIPASSAVTVLVRFSDVSASGRLFGIMLSGCRMFIDPYNGDFRINYQSNGAQFITPELGAGVVGVAGRSCFRNGVKEGSPMTDWTVTATQSIWIGKPNDSFGITGNMQAVAIYSATPSDAQVAAVSAAMAALA